MVEFPVRKDQILPAEITLKLTAQDFYPPIQHKNISIPPDGDSGPFSFSIVPKRPGNLTLNLEILKNETSLLTRIVRTTAVETKTKGESSLLILSIPMVVFVRMPSIQYSESSQNQPGAVSVNIQGNVQGNIVVGSGNQVPKEGSAREKTERELKEKVEHEAKLLPKKPFTKILDPSSLSPKETKSALGETAPSTLGRIANPTYKRWLIIGGIALVFLLYAALGGNYLLNNLSATETPAVTPSVTSKPPTPTATKVPATATITSVPPTPTLGIGSTIVSEKDGMVLVYVPAGEFTMGSNDENDDEKPERQVNLDAFWMDQTEVTNAMYTKCVADGACQAPTITSSYSNASYYGNSEFNDYPVLYANWMMATTYCSWADRRLPTEAEWEKAARGTNGNIYPWGDEPPNVNLLNYNQNIGDTTEVGKYPDGVSIYGALDMAGNVWEWVSSLYQPYPYDANDGRENLSSSDNRVLRGDSWSGNDNGVRSAFRDWVGPTGSSYFIGFRCSRSP